MKVLVAAPPWQGFMQGFNEIAQSEIAALFEQRGDQVKETWGEAEDIADLVIIIAQYREEARGEWLLKYRKKYAKVITGVYGKAAVEAREWIINNNSDIDFVVRGEPEKTLLQLAEEMSCKTFNLQSIPGISCKNATGEIIDTSIQTISNNYDGFPAPKLTYLKKGRDKYPICVLNSSKGCHGQCFFCEGCIFRKQMQGPTYRAKTADRVIDEIQYAISTYQRRLFAFSDDNFLVDGDMGIERAYKFAELIKKNKYIFGLL